MALTELDRKGSLLRDMVSALASHGGVGGGCFWKRLSLSCRLYGWSR